jgi:hypothetical protein
MHLERDLEVVNNMTKGNNGDARDARDDGSNGKDDDGEGLGIVTLVNRKVI